MRPAASFPALIAAVAVTAAGCGGASDEQQVRDAAKALSRALAAHDYARACRLLSFEAQSQVEALTATSRGCATALRQSRRVAGPAAERMPTAAEIDAAQVTLRGDRATLTYTAGTHATERYAKRSDRWVVAADSPVSGQRSFAACWQAAGAAIATRPADLGFAAGFVKRAQATGEVPAGGAGAAAGGGVNYIYAGGWVIFYQYGIHEPTNTEVIRDPSSAIAVAYVRDPSRVQSVVRRASEC